VIPIYPPRVRAFFQDAREAQMWVCVFRGAACILKPCFAELESFAAQIWFASLSKGEGDAAERQLS
jgi:hypothetical protein